MMIIKYQQILMKKTKNDSVRELRTYLKIVQLISQEETYVIHIIIV
jgi:hypothetical protein